MVSRAERAKDDRSEFRFKIPSRVMMSHTDQEGIVNNISFFIYLEMGRFEYFRSLGLTLADIKRQNDLMVTTNGLVLRVATWTLKHEPAEFMPFLGRLLTGNA